MSFQSHDGQVDSGEWARRIDPDLAPLVKLLACLSRASHELEVAEDLMAEAINGHGGPVPSGLKAEARAHVRIAQLTLQTFDRAN
jgi:hypothetical protein